MEGIKNIFDSIKTFLWDIIGYLLPGSYLIILLYVCLNDRFHPNLSLDTKANSLYTYAFLILSYFLGFSIYGFGCLKERLLGKHSYKNRIGQRLRKRVAFILTCDHLSNTIVFPEDNYLGKVPVEDIRELAMSFVPEQDQKIYTFTFRSEISNHIGNVSLVIGTLGLISIFFDPLEMFRSFQPWHISLYMCLIISYLFLREARNRFYEITLGLPFSLYIADHYCRLKIEEEIC